MATPWLNSSGELIVAGGQAALCDDCPCGAMMECCPPGESHVCSPVLYLTLTACGGDTTTFALDLVFCSGVGSYYGGALDTPVIFCPGTSNITVIEVSVRLDCVSDPAVGYRPFAFVKEDLGGGLPSTTTVGFPDYYCDVPIDLDSISSAPRAYTGNLSETPP